MAKKRKTKQVEEEYTAEEQQKIRELAHKVSKLLDNERFDIVAEALSVVLGFCLAHTNVGAEGITAFLLNLNRTVLQHAMGSRIILDSTEGSVH